MMINSKNAGQVIEEGKFPVCKKGIGMNPIFLCQLCRCWVHKRCSDVRGTLKEDSKFQCQRCAS